MPKEEELKEMSVKELEQHLSEQEDIRRAKLAELQNSGNDPFGIYRVERTHTSDQIRQHYESLTAEEVVIAGRLMTKRIQGKAGFADLMAHDCSGFLSWLMRETGIWDDRKNCDGLWALCDTVARNELILGDFLFRNSTTNANDETHVGLYLGRGMVIHAKGRDVGVVVEGINQGGSGYWHKCGRCKLLYK